ncbi:mammalian cell entry protein [Nocardioides phosphati]|uniref:Mammalian cell entry protein n=1 Tax=Nocardioides phosphati TaxID=1867775 RepID=A0ABQ2N6A0_9ACTN|nr:MCE family protein [Nocardioides phosphati]GGO86113.1 mammalian cell entry protein [Nocardioides phosphati]
MKTALRGVLGTLLIVAAVISTLTYRSWPLLRNTDTLRIEFAEAGGLKSNDEVVVSGASVGKVSGIELDGDKVMVTVKLSDHDLKLGDDTRADIVTVTLLGRAAVRLEPRGRGDLARGSTIPVARTGSPYDVTQALSQLTDETRKVDSHQVAEALRQVSATFADTPKSLGPALAGIRKVSTTIAANDTSLQDLLANAKDVTGVLASRDQQISRLLTSGNDLLAELDARQQVITDLLASARALSAQLTAVARENGAVLPPTLIEVNKVVDLLNRNKRNLQMTITGLRNYATAFGEAISSGPFFDAYIQNLTSPGTLAPVISGLTP